MQQRSGNLHRVGVLLRLCLGRRYIGRNWVVGDGKYEIRETLANTYVLYITNRPLPPFPALAPGAAAGRLYVVNGQDHNISFEISLESDQGAPMAISLMAREGKTLRCTSCIVQIRTDTSEVRRKVQAGESYMIVWDTSRRRYDLRVYSQ